MLEKLNQIECIDKIIVNTDAPNLISTDHFVRGKILKKKRKKSLCGDKVSMNLIIRDDVENEIADYYIMTHATNPLLKTATIEKAIDDFFSKYKDKKADSLFTVNKIQSRFYDKYSNPINHNPKDLLPTQDLDPMYEENSNLYIFSRESFLITNARIGQSPLMYETPLLESIDIDHQDDWDLASLIFKQQLNT